jgi:pilus assembly protein Flp/PilA
MAAFFRKLLRDRKGGTAIEYGLILALIVLALMSALIALADTNTALWNRVSNKVQSAR